MNLKTQLLAAAAAVSLTAGGVGANTIQYDPPVELDLTFVFHIDQDLAEQDVFVEREPGSGQVFRPTKGERDMAQPLYAAAAPLGHQPFDPAAVGPYPKGKSLDMTLGEWFEAKGTGKYSCKDGEGTLRVTFDDLVPDATYTMWHFFLAWPPTDPFIGTYDLPVGSRDGEEAVFHSDAAGAAVFERAFKPCLQLSGEHLAAGLAVAWHSDGRTWGPEPGTFPTESHVQLYMILPPRAGI